MGIAVAEAARDRGARVTLVAGMVSVPLPDGVTIVRAETAAEMRVALLGLLAVGEGRASFDALVMAAAVADFRPARPAAGKIARADAGLTLELVPNPDILAEIGRTVGGGRAGSDGHPLPHPILVGFAAETGSLERAPAKLRAKGLDFLVANDVAEPGSGFGTDTNRVSILAADGGRDDLPLLPKREVADRILDRVAAALDGGGRAAHTGATNAAPAGAAPNQESSAP
jgi:phosphopantothenoylcysteine decarboxylase/phosphopantothenate--cysteine ligase